MQFENWIRAVRLTVGVALTGIFSVTTSHAADPDSFGRSVKYLDVGFSPPVWYFVGTFSCPSGSTCRQITAAANTSQTFDETDRIVINLPAGATNSLLCFSYSPSVSYSFFNGTTDARASTLNNQLSVTINSAVLANPLLINKATGQLFNGSLTFSPLVSENIYRTLAPNAQDRETRTGTRECINGIINTQALQTTYGLTLTQAQSVMRSAMTVRFSTKTVVYNASLVSFAFGVRLFGD